MVVVQVLQEFAVEVFLSYKSLNARKGKIQVPTSYIQDLPLRFFFVLRVASSQESEGFIFRRATYKGTYVEAVEFRQAGLSPKIRGT